MTGRSEPCENARLSLKNGRVYCRMFNHAAARDLRAQGWTYAQIAEKFGVSATAIALACDPEFRQRDRERTHAWIMSGVCPVCGKKGTSRKRKGADSRCRECANAAQRTSVRLDDSGNLVEIRCGACETWKPLEEFSPRKRTLSGGTGGSKRMCRQCDSAARKAYRERHKVPCERCGEPCLSASEKKRNDRPTGLCKPCWQKLHTVQRARRAA